MYNTEAKNGEAACEEGKTTARPTAHTKVFPRRSKNMRTSTSIITYIIHIYIDMATQERWETKSCHMRHKYMFENMCMVPKETNKKGLHISYTEGLDA